MQGCLPSIFAFYSRTESNSSQIPCNSTPLAMDYDSISQHSHQSTRTHRSHRGGRGCEPMTMPRGGGGGADAGAYIYICFQFQVFASAGVPPPPQWYGSHHGRQGPTTQCYVGKQLHEQTVFYNPVCRTLHSTEGEGKMMMIACVCVDIACVFLHVLMVCSLCLYRGYQPYGGAPPPLTERKLVHIYIYVISQYII